MNETKTNRHIGHKIWYAVAIALSVLVLVLSLVGVVGTWVIQRTASNTVVALLGAAYDMAGGVRQVGSRIDQSAVQIKQITTNISDSSAKISQNVNDKGLLLTLLPADQEQQLVDQVKQIQDTFNSIRDVLNSAMAMYNSVNRLPFVNLPKASSDQVAKLENTVSQIQTTEADLRQKVQDFRSNAASKVDVVSQAADKATKAVNDLRNRIEKLDQNLASLQAKATRLQTLLPNLIVVFAVITTLFLIFVIYTQVEFIRLCVRRWKELGGQNASLPAAPAEATISTAVQ